MSLPSAPAAANGVAPGNKRGKKRRQNPSHRPVLERGLPQEAAAAPGQQQQQQPPLLSEAQQQQQPQQQPQVGNGNTKFARALGSTDYHTREQGLAALSRWLLHRPAVSELDMLKLWRGVFFCFWHSDKEPVQEDLAARLAGLLLQLQPAMARLYWAGMLATLRAEWFAMDRHRVNKFLMLVRKFVAALLQRMAASNWDVSVVRAFTGADLPMGQALLPLDHTKSLGFSYHLADVWLPELRAAAGERALPPGALQALLQPFADVLQQSGEAAQVARVRESVFEALVQDLTAAAAAAAGAGPGSSDSEDEDDGSVWAYCAQLDAQAYAEHLFSLGAAPDVKSRNREALYGVSKQLERVAAKRRKLAPPASAGAAAAAAEHGGRASSAGLSNGAADGAAAAAAAAPGEGGSASKKQKKASKKRSKAEAAVQQALADAEQQLGAAAVAAPPRSSSKKHKQQQPQEQPSPGNHHQQEQHVPGAAAAAAAATPGSGLQQKHKKHKTPGGSGSKPRGVVINLRGNLYHEHGAPPPAPDVRTPPRSKPKGSALKSASKNFEPERSGGGGSKAARVTPNSVPRARAAAFF